ncbi:CPBP family intramembrane glutamic endopeptidase [Shimia sp. FJ5]|uniref:CPBP family intramembrane glutamic endopeptidase n=1 Tax=Shimia sp. FJ5 TaxID=3079054 RepID=UPI00260C68D1|nr:CPBP family intramembrane glutamic endopeptidase [Shimia sp. FJ5]MDV4145187.1 CPBP family intramembrane glutamic endopeptidase [Shimia sp. FJ5]
MPYRHLVAPASESRLWAEFLLFFVIAPVAIAALLPATVMFSALFALTALGLVLLHATDGFHWRELRQGNGAISLRFLAVFAVSVFLTCLAVVYAFEPASAFSLLQYEPMLLLMILLLYPVLSALPQEIVFRPLFFRRYGAILPEGHHGIILNAAIFSLAHLMYWNWVVAAMTFSGGLVFAWAYEIRRSFPLAVLLHAVAGNLVFLTGLGIYFYSGNVVRPF